MTTPSTSHLPDDPLQAALIVTGTLNVVLMACEEIQRFAAGRIDQAPTATLRACDLAAQLAAAATGWAEQWPQTTTEATAPATHPASLVLTNQVSLR